MKKLLALLFALLAAPAGAQVIPSGPVGSLNYWGVGGLSQVLNPGLAGQCLTTQGTGSAPVWVNCQVSSLSLLPPINTNQFYGNVSGQFSPPIGVDVNTILNTVGYDIARPPPVESILYKSNVGPLFNWQALFPGTAGSLLTSGGPTNPPFWAPNQIQANLSGICTTIGALLYFNTPSNLWTCLNPGTAGQVLQTGGAGANPSYLTLSGTAPLSYSSGAFSIAANGIANSLLAQAPANTEKCNSTGSLGNVQDCARPWVVLTDPTIGAKCDGVTDDTAALQAWASGIVAGGNYIIPNSSCLFKGPLAFSTVNNVTIQGAGKQSQLLYGGATTTGTIITMGSASGNSCVLKGWTLLNFRAMSSTVMTGGDGVLVGNMCDSTLTNFEVGGDLNGNQNWFNAVHFSGGNTVHMRSYNFSASNIAEIINGDASNQFSDMFQAQGEIAHAAIGLDIAGNVGGFNIEQTDILENTIDAQVDQSQVAVPNNQLFFGDQVFFAGPTGTGLNITDPGLNTGISVMVFTGTWFGGAQTGLGSGNCLFVQSTAIHWAIAINGGTVINCQGDGVHSDSAGSRVWSIGTRFDYNVGYGFNQTTSNALVTIETPNCGPNGQTPACFSPNVNSVLSLGATSGSQGKVLFNGATSGSAYIQANSNGALQLGNNVGSLNTLFTDGANGTSFIVSNAAGAIANQWTVTPTASGTALLLNATGTDSNISARLNVKGTGKFNISGGTAPTLTAGCNGSGQAISGNDNHGTITGQTTASTSCTLTFSATYNATPDCVVTGLSSPLIGAVTVSTSTIVVNFASTANYKWSYHCLGN